MARPRKLNADWFPHDVNERNKPMVKAIRRKFSHLGYAVWTYLQETLTSSDLFRIKWDDVTVELLAADYDVEPEDLIAIVEYAVKIGLLEIGDGFIFSAEHRNGLKPLLLKRERDLLFLDNKAKSKTDAGGAEIIDAENEPKTSENTTKKERNPKNEMIFDAENVEKTEPAGVFDAENRRKQGFSSIIGEFPFFKSKSNSKSNTHTVIPTWKGGVGENQTAEFLDWLDSAYPEIAANGRTDHRGAGPRHSGQVQCRGYKPHHRGNGQQRGVQEQIRILDVCLVRGSRHHHQEPQSRHGPQIHVQRGDRRGGRRPGGVGRFPVPRNARRHEVLDA